MSVDFGDDGSLDARDRGEHKINGRQLKKRVKNGQHKMCSTSKWPFWRLHRNSIILVELYDFRRVHFWPPKLEAQL